MAKSEKINSEATNLGRKRIDYLNLSNAAGYLEIVSLEVCTQNYLIA